jgi:hypothetical protein
VLKETDRSCCKTNIVDARILSAVLLAAPTMLLAQWQGVFAPTTKKESIEYQLSWLAIGVLAAPLPQGNSSVFCY